MVKYPQKVSPLNNACLIEAGGRLVEKRWQSNNLARWLNPLTRLFIGKFDSIRRGPLLANTPPHEKAPKLPKLFRTAAWWWPAATASRIIANRPQITRENSEIHSERTSKNRFEPAAKAAWQQTEVADTGSITAEFWPCIWKWRGAAK